MRIDASTIDDALIAYLAADLELRALAPDGVHWDTAPHTSRAFVIVSLVLQRGESVFGGRAFDDTLYAVKAVIKNGAGNAQAAAARIDLLLDEGVLPVAGFAAMYRDDEDGRIRYTELDDFDKSIEWQHRGGRYRVQISHDPVGLTPPAFLEQRR